MPRLTRTAESRRRSRTDKYSDDEVVLDQSKTSYCNDANDCCLILRYPTTSDDRTVIKQSDAATNDSLVLRDSTSLGSNLDTDTDRASALANDCSLVQRNQDTSSAMYDSSLYSCKI